MAASNDNKDFPRISKASYIIAWRAYCVIRNSISIYISYDASIFAYLFNLLVNLITYWLIE